MDWILRISTLETRICSEIIPSLDLHLFCNKTSLNDFEVKKTQALKPLVMSVFCCADHGNVANGLNI